MIITKRQASTFNQVDMITGDFPLNVITSPINPNKTFHSRRNTYVVRPVKPAGGVAAPGVVDPYRYYYDQQYANV